jgi:hypothetical protein
MYNKCEYESIGDVENEVTHTHFSTISGECSMDLLKNT